ncbi:MAG: hypothetical protein SXA11_26025 [Cyanobacteriota bacterium]|nr:hypothetical protein [Cyanobacteriota bacterium]
MLNICDRSTYHHINSDREWGLDGNDAALSRYINPIQNVMVS